MDIVEFCFEQYLWLYVHVWITASERRGCSGSGCINIREAVERLRKIVDLVDHFGTGMWKHLRKR